MRTAEFISAALTMKKANQDLKDGKISVVKHKAIKLAMYQKVPLSEWNALTAESMI